MRPPTITREDLSLATPFAPPQATSHSGPRGVVFFDLGGVVFDLHWEAFYFQTLAMLHEWLPQEPPGAHKDRLSSLFASPAIAQWEVGALGPSSFAQVFREHMGVPHLPMPLIRRLHSSIVGAARPQVVALAQDLARRGWAIGVLSNSTPWHEVDLAEAASPYRWAQLVVFSQDHNLRKPQPAIYEKALAEARWCFGAPHLEPQHCYFIDDTPANVRAAQDVGWNARLVNLLKDEHIQAAAQGQLSQQGLAKLSMDETCLVSGLQAAQRVEALLKPLLEVV